MSKADLISLHVPTKIDLHLKVPQKLEEVT